MTDYPKNRCPMCTEYYESVSRVPKVLKCGHTFCLPCILAFVAIMKMCPMCSKPVEEPLTMELPTNHAVYSIEPTNKDPEEFELKKESLLNLAKKQKEYITKNLQILTQSDDKLNSPNKTLKKCNIKNDDDGHVFDDKDLNEIEESLAKIQLKLYSCYKPEIIPSITLSSFPTKEKFICKILIEVFRKKNVYAFHSEWYNKKIFWGKLSYKDGKLYIHTFTPDLPIYPYLFVPFRDLKNCMTKDNFHTFIDIAGDHLVCTMLTSSKQTKIFTKLCSGEEGISLKGLKSRIKVFSELKNEVAEIENTGKQNISDDDYEFLDSLPSEIDEIFDDHLLQIRMLNKRFEIVNGPNVLNKRFEILNGQNVSSVKDVPDEVIVGSAQSNGFMFSNLFDIDACIEDSGISLSLPIRKKSLSPRIKIATCI